MVVDFVASGSEGPRDLESIAERLKRRSKDDFKGRHFEASLILQAVCWYLRYPLSYRDIEELFVERGLGRERRRNARSGKLARSCFFGTVRYSPRAARHQGRL